MIINYKWIVVAFGFIVFDIVSGVIGALVRGDFKSSVMREGGKHKLFLLLVLSFGVAMDVAQGYVDLETQLGFTVPVNASICAYVTVMELLSIVENIVLTYPNALPKIVTDMLYNAARKQGVEYKEKDEQ